MPRPATEVLEALIERGIYGGVSARAPGLYRESAPGLPPIDETLLTLAVTELHDRADIDRLATALAEVCR